MPFVNSDIYLQQGCQPLPNEDWVDNVYKFDTSSFYNWEQDNLPIYDLEKRTDYLYNSLGSLTGSGYGLIVSSAAPATQPDGFKYFTSVQGAIDALPSRIDSTVIIEVALSGALGDLNLKNLDFGPTGGLEIINRGFLKVYQCSADVTTRLNTITGGGTGRAPITQVSSLDIKNTIDANRISCSNPAILIGSGIFNNSNISFIMKPEFTHSSERRTVGNPVINIDYTGTEFLNQIASNKFIVSGGEGHPTGFSSINNFPIDGRVTGEREDVSTGDASVVGLVYGNYFNHILVDQCGGPIYIRGFAVDNGLKSVETGGKESIYINNSGKITLENCIGIRSQVAGINIVNSDVTLSRGFVAGLNMQVSGSTRQDGYIPGLVAENSRINLSVNTSATLGVPADCPFVFAYNDIGVRLINSRLTSDYSLRGSDKNGATGKVPSDDFLLVAQATRNGKSGINCTGSVIDLDGRLSVFENYYGVIGVTSEFNLSEFSIDNNALLGLHLTNSNFTYNKKLQQLFLTNTNRGWRAQSNIEDNWQNVYLNNSKMSYLFSYSMDDKSGAMRIFRNHGRLGGGAAVPSVKMENSSTFIATNLQAATYGYLNSGGNNSYGDTSGGTFFGSSGSVKGAAFSLDTGSVLELHGTKVSRTNIIGPEKSVKQQKTAGIYANNGSKVMIQGPTTISQFGVDILAENGSTVEITPHKLLGTVNSLEYNQSVPGNQSDIELHASRACLVVDKSSVLLMKDLGDYHNCWSGIQSSPFYASADYNRGDYMGLSAATSAASLKFYANTQGASSVSVSANAYDFTGSSITYFNSTNNATNLDNSEWGTGDSESQYSKYSNGGVCIHALRGSDVVAKNVNFKAGHGQASAAILDEDLSANCGKIYIWSISPDSTLTASYCSVSSIYPSGAAYIGPPALYASSCTSALSGAPSGTPDTSSLSVLDSFGLNANAAYAVGYNPGINKGPFRIFFTPTDPVRFVGYASGAAGLGPTSSNTPFAGATIVAYSEPYQLIAQGYNPPIDLSSTYVRDSVLSALYTKEFSGMTGGYGKFFYTKDYLDPTYEDRILLDDSAMNTFANAKNAMVAKSNRVKLVSYLRNTIEEVGESGTLLNGTGLKSIADFDLDRE